jgi:DNA modification methylase
MKNWPADKVERRAVSDLVPYAKSGDFLFDPFTGSGTQIIAAEKTATHCYGMELDPVYCDVAVRRWQNFTGQDAVLEGTGESFNAVAARKDAA